MNYPVKPEALPKPSGKLFPDGLVRGRLIDELSCETGSWAKPSGQLFPNGLVRGRLIDDPSCDTKGVGQTIGEVVPRWFG